MFSVARSSKGGSARKTKKFGQMKKKSAHTYLEKRGFAYIFGLQKYFSLYLPNPIQYETSYVDHIIYAVDDFYLKMVHFDRFGQPLIVIMNIETGVCSFGLFSAITLEINKFGPNFSRSRGLKFWLL